MVLIDNVDEVFLTERDSWFRYAYGMLGNKEDALDVLHDSYEKVKRKSATSDISNIKGYLFLTIRNQCYDYIEQRKKRMNLGISPDELSIDEENLDSKDELNLLITFLDQLPTRQRSIIILKDIEGFDYSEVSKMLDMDKNSIRVNLSIARKKVRNAFKVLREKELEKRNE